MINWIDRLKFHSKNARKFPASDETSEPSPGFNFYLAYQISIFFDLDLIRKALGPRRLNKSLDNIKRSTIALFPFPSSTKLVEFSLLPNLERARFLVFSSTSLHRLSFARLWLIMGMFFSWLISLFVLVNISEKTISALCRLS